MSQSLTRQLQYLSLARRAVPSTSAPLVHSRAASSSWSLPSLRNLLPSRSKAVQPTEPTAAAPTDEAEAGKGLFDAAVEDEVVRETVLSRRPVKPATFVSLERAQAWRPPAPRTNRHQG